MKMKYIIAGVVMLLSLTASADQMVIDGNAIRNGDSVAKLLQFAGRPLTQSVVRDPDHGVVQYWVYINNGTEYTVKVRSNQVVAIDWKHAR